MPYMITLKSPLPGGLDPRTTRFVAGGASRNDPGNSVIMDHDQTIVTKSVMGANVPIDFPVNGITISRAPVYIADNITLTSAAQRTKEDLANFVEKGYVVVALVGTGPLTAAQIRAL